MVNSGRIVKNTLFLAVRMFMSMGISFYASRVVLQQLGVTDFGIYNVVGGVALIMSFCRSALTAAIQRYMNVELGQSGGKNMQQIMSACCVCVAGLLLAFLVVAEVAGVWFLDSCLSIPEGRMGDARIVFQLSLTVVAAEMLRVPFNSLIIAHERMSFYAYNSVIEAMLKLGVVICLSLFGGNKLLVYAGLLVVVAVVVDLSYVWYCRRILPEVRFSLKAEWSRVREIGKFSGWNVVTSLSDVVYQQGASMVLNVFFGVALNATMGIANQVKTAVYSFTRSVQMASDPQTVKTYAAGEHEQFQTLFMRVSRISFFLVLFLGVPVMLNTSYLLSVWLTVLPPYAEVFVQLMVLFCMIDSLTGPLWITMQAAGRIAVYQSVVCVVWLLCLPVTYVVFKLGYPPYWAMILLAATNLLLIGIRLWFTSRVCGVRVKAYLRRVAAPVLEVAGVACVYAFVVHNRFGDGFTRFLVTGVLWCAVAPTAFYLLGLEANERKAVREKVRKYFRSFT